MNTDPQRSDVGAPGGNGEGEERFEALVIRRGFVKLLRSELVEELVKRSHGAWALLSIIAMRARWKEGWNAHGLKRGEALIGDWKDCGFATRKAYRWAAKILAEGHFAAFKGASRGTIATLVNTDIFELFDSRGAITGASEGPPKGHLRATKKKVKQDRRQKGRGKVVASATLPPLGPMEVSEQQIDDFLGIWGDAYEASNTYTYLPQRFDREAARRLLSTSCEPDRIVDLVMAVRRGDNQFLANQANTLKGTADHWGEIAPQGELLLITDDYRDAHKPRGQA